jgi:hypothetical protein
MQECHPGVHVVRCDLLVKTLKLYGKCAMKAGDITKAEQVFVRLCNLCSVCPTADVLSRSMHLLRAARPRIMVQGSEYAAVGKVTRQIDWAEACMLLGGVLAVKGHYMRAGEVYGQAMKAMKHLRPQLPADHKLVKQLEIQMIELLHKQQDNKDAVS